MKRRAECEDDRYAVCREADGRRLVVKPCAEVGAADVVVHTGTRKGCLIYANRHRGDREP